MTLTASGGTILAENRRNVLPGKETRVRVGYPLVNVTVVSQAAVPFRQAHRGVAVTDTRKPGRAATSDAVRVVPLSPETATGICLLADGVGWRCARISLAGCHDKEGLLARTAEALNFPDWFGKNWDAWFDCLVDLSWLPADGYVVVFEEADELRESSPEAFDTAVSILEDAAQVWASRNVPFYGFIGSRA
jgi:RNAse (barnase) inhibitor barstar